MSDALEDPEDAVDGTVNDLTGDDSYSFPWSEYGSAKTWVLSILLGAVFGLYQAVLGQFIDAGGAVATALEAAGGAFTYAGRKIADVVFGVLELPFGLAETLAAGAGPFAPIFAVVAWALAAALVGLLAYLVWRVFTWV